MPAINFRNQVQKGGAEGRGANGFVLGGGRRGREGGEEEILRRGGGKGRGKRREEWCVCGGVNYAYREIWIDAYTLSDKR